MTQFLQLLAEYNIYIIVHPVGSGLLSELRWRCVAVNDSTELLLSYPVCHCKQVCDIILSTTVVFDNDLAHEYCILQWDLSYTVISVA